MTDKDVLLAARELVATAWTQREYARAADGLEVDPLSENAACFCSKGALVKVLGSWEIPESIENLLSRSTHLLTEKGTPMTVSYVGYNDTQPHESVLAMWDKAIEAVT